MRVFVTGVSGYIGDAVAKAFRSKGHHVSGLVRSQEHARKLQSDEIVPMIGDLRNPESYLHHLEKVEVAVHCARDHSTEGVDIDASTIHSILSIFSKTKEPRTFIYTSGIWVYGSCGSQPVDESISVSPLGLVDWRPKHEEMVLNGARGSIRTVVIRPGVVYGGSRGLMSMFYASAEKGKIEIAGSGENRWPMIHVQDLAYAYVSAAEKELSRVALNVADDSTSTVSQMAEAVAKAAGVQGEILSLSVDEAYQKFGPVTEGLLLDLMINNSRLKRMLGWRVHHAPFIQEAGLHYQAWKADR